MAENELPNEPGDEPADDLPEPPTTVWDAIQHPRIARGLEGLLSALTKAIEERGRNDSL